MLLVNSKACKDKGKVNDKANAKYKPKPQQKAFTTLQSTDCVRKRKFVYFFCGKSSYWRRHCKDFLKSKKKKSVVSTLGMHIIEINFSHLKSWVIYTGCGSYSCSNMHEHTCAWFGWYDLKTFSNQTKKIVWKKSRTN